MQNRFGAWWGRVSPRTPSAGLGVAPGLAPLIVLAIALAACSPHAGPGADAVEAYVQRKTPTQPAATGAGRPGEGPNAQADAGAAGGAADGADAATAGATTPGTAEGQAPTGPLATRLRITVVRGQGLPDTDAGPGVTDPYVVLDYEGERFKTSVADGTLEPVWGDSFVVDVRPGAALGVTLMDRDAWSSDEKLGVVNDPLPPVRVGETVDLDVPFRGGDFGTVRVTLLGLQ